jgi:hypothetical protein
MCRLECVDICIYVYIYIWLSLSSSQFTLCFLCEEFVSWLKWEHFYFIFWNGEVLEIQREGKVVTFSMYFETLKDVQRLVNYSHCWGEESWEGHYCKYIIYIYIYIKEGAGILLFQLPWQESFQSKPSLWFFAQLNWTFLKNLWWSNGLHWVMPWRVACLWLALNQLS